MTALRLAGVGHRSFGSRTPAPADPFLVRYYQDMADLYGTTFDQERLERANRNTFSDMAAGLLGELPPLDAPLDLVIVTSAVPDFDSRQSAVSCLAEAVPGSPTAFALGEQGNAAPHTALRLAGQYARAGGSRRALVTVMDQTTAPADSGPPRQGEDARDGAAALLLTTDGPGAPVTVRQHSGLSPQEAYERLRAALMGASVLIAGPGLDPQLAVPAGTAVEVLRPSPEFPCSGVWARLSGQLPRFARERGTVVIADYEPSGQEWHGKEPQGPAAAGVGLLSLCTVDFADQSA